MKKYIITFALVCFLASTAVKLQAEKLPAAIGPYFSEKASISAITTPQGRKNGILFSGTPAFGASAYLPLSKASNFGMNFDLGYETYGYMMKDGNELSEFEFKYSYLCFNPSVYFEGFTFGFNFAFPMAANMGGKEISTSVLNSVVEAKIGWIQPIYSDAAGRLNLFITGGYMLGGVYNDFVKNDPLKEIYPAIAPQKITSSFNPRVASITVGFNFLFNLTPPAEANGGDSEPI